MVTSSGGNGAERWNSGGYDRVHGDVLFNVDTWYHLVDTYDGSFMRRYINGAASGSLSASLPLPDTTVSLRVAAQGGNPWNFWKGTIDEVALYNRALSLAEVQAHYAAAG